VNIYILGAGIALIITGLVMSYNLYRTRHRDLRARRRPLNLR
jgi:hypothetical protein